MGCKWVYRIKHKANGTIERYKARLVARDFTQTEGIDFFGTFSLVAKLTTVRVLLALASAQNWHLEQLDVNDAFLYGELHKEVHMELPQGVIPPKLDQVCRLKKSLYGLRQTSKQWYKKLSIILMSTSYAQSQADHSLFTKANSGLFTALLIYVDDMILVGDDIAKIKKGETKLDSLFKIKDLEPLKFFLGLEVARSYKGISLCQQMYTLELIKSAGLLTCKPASPLMNHTIKLVKDDGQPFGDVEAYRRSVSQLLYLTNIRPTIYYDVIHLSQFLSQPMVSHCATALHIPKCLKSTPGRDLFFLIDSKL